MPVKEEAGRSTGREVLGLTLANPRICQQTPDIDENGVDLAQIRAMLDRKPGERLSLVTEFINSLVAVRPLRFIRQAQAIGLGNAFCGLRTPNPGIVLQPGAGVGQKVYFARSAGS